MNIQTLHELSERQRNQLFGWGSDLFGVDHLNLEWRRKDEHIVIEVDGEAVSHVGVLRNQTVTVALHAITVGGIGGVVTVPFARKKGYATAAVDSAASLLKNDSELQFAMLFCLESMLSFYTRQQWILVRDPVFFQQSSGIVQSPLKTMVLPLRGVHWPSGAIRLEGRPW